MSQQQDQQHMHGERRRAPGQSRYQGVERRKPMAFGETADTQGSGAAYLALQDNEDEQKRLALSKQQRKPAEE